MTHEPPTAAQTITDIVQRLSERFPSTPAETIRRVVTETYADFADAKVRDFVEVLVEKQAKKRLKNEHAAA